MAIANLDDFRDHDLLSDNPNLTRVLEVFARISSIPSPSKKEEAMREELNKIAQEQGWEVQQDAVGNVAMSIPATEGLEGATPVVIQGHMDIVTKEEDQHVPRVGEIYDAGTEGDETGLWMRTQGQNMTLGADNKMGVAMAVGAMMDENIKHGPVTILVTVDEETGMTGAVQLDPKLLPESSILINLDAEDGSTEICIGCAGSTDVTATFPIFTRETLPEDFKGLNIEVAGLPGGHSGIEIHNDNGNAIQLMAAVLSDLVEEGIDVRVLALNGGSARNAIPSQSVASIGIPADKEEEVKAIVKGFVESVKAHNVLGANETPGEPSHEKAQGLEITVSDLDGDIFVAIGRDTQKAILDILESIPTGPFSSAELPNVGELVTLSNNLGVITTGFNRVELITMARGANIADLEAKLGELIELFPRNIALVDYQEPTAGWLEDPTESLAIKIATEAAEAVAGSHNYKAYHAGLEAGIIIDKGENLSGVAIGPLIKEGHTPRERVSLESLDESIAVLNQIIRRVAELD